VQPDPPELRELLALQARKAHKAVLVSRALQAQLVLKVHRDRLALLAQPGLQVQLVQLEPRVRKVLRVLQE
jgi:hypothetical protein